MFQRKWTSLCWHPRDLPSCMGLRKLCGCPGYIKVHFTPENQKSQMALTLIAVDKVLRSTHKRHGFERQDCTACISDSTRVRYRGNTGLEAGQIDLGSQATWDLPLLNVKSPPPLLAQRRVWFLIIPVTNYHPSSSQSNSWNSSLQIGEKWDQGRDELKAARQIREVGLFVSIFKQEGMAREQKDKFTNQSWRIWD